MLKKRDLSLDFLIIFISLLGLFSLLAINEQYFKMQSYFLVVAIIAYVAISFIPKNLVSLLVKSLYVLNIILLIYLFFFGKSIRGSTSWITLGTINYQPAEFFKIITAYITAEIVAKQESNKNIIKKIFMVFLIPLVLVVTQPDFGTFLILFGIIFSIYFLAQMTKKRFLIASAILLLSFSIGFTFLKPYQKARITSFFKQSDNNLEEGYNVQQAKIAVGSGGLFGKGFKGNTQVKLNFLPEAHTDFIFAASAETFGLVYALIIVCSLFLLIKKLKDYTFKEKIDIKTKYYAFGLLFIIFVQTFLNIGMNIGIMPVTGLTLPLISYGGTSLVTIFTGIALLQKLSWED